MRRQIGYITIEESTGGAGLTGIAPLIVDEFPNSDLHIMEDTGYYFVIKFFTEEYTDVQDIIAATSYILAGEGIQKYTVTINCDE